MQTYGFFLPVLLIPLTSFFILLLPLATTFELSVLLISMIIGSMLGVLAIYLKKRAANLLTPDKKAIEHSVLSSLVAVVKTRDKYTDEHSHNVAKYALAVAKSMNLSEEDCSHIYMGCQLHDLGKVYIPNSVLNKNSSLTDEEYEIMKAHPQQGYEVITKLDIFHGTSVADIVRYHHERVDGTGYPLGLKQHEIPIEARIVAVCDAYDAMTTNRSYREAMQPEEALSIIRASAGSHFDPLVVEHFMNCMNSSHEFESKQIS